MITLKNETMRAEINPLGAELTELVRLDHNKSLIWNDQDGKYWKRHAPILFPTIGRSNKDTYSFAGKQYAMKQHGFARDYYFDIVKQEPDSAVLRLSANAETKLVYPFDFDLTVTYWLMADAIQITYSVVNNSEMVMPFALGFHPGFALEKPLNEYVLTFTGSDKPIAQYGIGPAPFRNGKISVFQEVSANQLELSHPLLDDGLIILDARDLTKVTLHDEDGDKVIDLDLKDFDYLALWSPEKMNAPFICVEPFAGLPDEYGDVIDLSQKLGNTLLQSDTVKTFYTTIGC